jgi:hypothetical protein
LPRAATNKSGKYKGIRIVCVFAILGALIGLVMTVGALVFI